VWGRIVAGAGRVLRPALARLSKAIAAGASGAIAGASLVIYSGSGTPEAIAAGAVSGFLTALGTYLAPANREG